MERTIHSDKRSNWEQQFDRFSGLSDPILCHILSFLPTKFSVATSILARRWRSLWADVPSLHFDNIYHDVDSPTSFPDIIHRVLLLHKLRNLNSFSIECYDECSVFQLETWLTIAISRNVQSLYLDYTCEFTLPRCIFSCETIVELRLDYCNCIGMTGFVSWPNLKKLQLSCVRFETNEALPELISSCPMLEELIIDKIMQFDLSCCCISSPMLRRLSVIYSFDDSPEIESEYRLEINAPALRYLKLEDWLSDYRSVGELTSLIEADINSIVDEDSTHIPVLERLSNVKYLTFSSRFVKFTDISFTESRFGRATIRFDNLTKLDLAADWHFLTKFLETADNLEVLILHELDNGQNIWKEPQQVPTCVLSYLTTVTICGFGSTKHQFEIVRYLLKNAKVLKMMEIHSHRQEGFEALKKISQFPRGSERCELHFH